MKTFRELRNTFAEANFKVDAKKLQLKTAKVKNVDVYYHSEKKGSKKVRVYVKPKGVREPEELGVYKDIKTAEKSAVEFVKLMGEDIKEGMNFLSKVVEESRKETEIEEGKFVPTPKDLNRLSSAMKLNSIQKDILFGFMNKGKITQKYGGRAAEEVEVEEVEEAVGAFARQKASVEDGVNAYVTAVNAAMMKGEFAKQYKEKKEELRARAASKYWRIETFEFGKASSIHAFVDKETGDIYKPAGWKAPAKGPRGNVTDPSYISKVSQTRHPQMGGHLYKRG